MTHLLHHHLDHLENLKLFFTFIYFETISNLEKFCKIVTIYQYYLNEMFCFFKYIKIHFTN